MRPILRAAASTWRSSTVRRSRPAAWASPASSRTRSTAARRCWCSSGARRTRGWRPGRVPTPRSRTRSTRSGSPRPSLRCKGESVTEVEGMVGTMYDHAQRITVSGRTVDIVGTGGDGARTVNISTMAALVAAGAGARVVKHGNRAASSACGSADVLEELGIPLNLTPARVAEVAERTGITFCFAPAFHPALRHAAGPRRELGVPTTFNFLGPLAHPASPAAQAVGVADGRVAGLVAGVLARRGIDALVFHGDDG